ncbi:elongation factor 1-gamma [Culicoides brevitarsis]|uniref:elongation factor 1-gamma n=1 Tax=Culicoides brevitarsis TaxID=469753 RepID=UPI00307CA91C
MAEIDCISRLANVLRVTQPGKLAYNQEKIVTRTKGTESRSGFTTICTEIARESRDNDLLLPKDAEMRVQVLQWLDYCALFVVPANGDKHTTTQLLKELNEYLSTKSYLVGQELTVADIAVFFAIEGIVRNLTTYDKENYVHLSRWFNHLQQQQKIACQGQGSPVNFATIHMLGWSKGTRL